MAHLAQRPANLERSGATIEVIVSPPRSLSVEFQSKGLEVPQKQIIGLIDTGASCSSIDESIASFLSLVIRDTESIYTPTGISEHNLYDVIIGLPQIGNKGYEIQVLGTNLTEQPFDALIGRDILKHCTLIYNGWDNSYTLHF